MSDDTSHDSAEEPHENTELAPDIEQLNASDRERLTEYEDPEALAAARSTTPGTKRPRRNRSAVGAVMLGIARGFQAVFEPRDKEKPAIVQEADDPEKEDGPYSVSFDVDHPENTVIRFRSPEASGDAKGDDSPN